MKFTINRENIWRALRALAPFQSEDCTREHLCGVKFEVADGALTVVATDGHTLAAATFPKGVAGLVVQDDGACLVPASSISVITAFLGERYDEGSVVVSFDKKTITVSADKGDSVTQPASDGKKFPAWRAVEKEPDADPVRAIAINPSYYERACSSVQTFAGSDCSHHGMILRVAGDLDPVHLTWEHADCGHFRAIVMPMRMP